MRADLIPRYRVCANGMRGHLNTPRRPVRDDEVEICVAFLRQCRRTKTPTLASSILKHVAEQWRGG